MPTPAERRAEADDLTIKELTRERNVARRTALELRGRIAELERRIKKLDKQAEIQEDLADSAQRAIRNLR